MVLAGIWDKIREFGGGIELNSRIWEASAPSQIAGIWESSPNPIFREMRPNFPATNQGNHKKPWESSLNPILRNQP